MSPTARSWPCARCDVGLVLLGELALVDRHLLLERGVVEELGGDRVDEVELPQLGDLVGDRFEPRVPRLRGSKRWWPSSPRPAPVGGVTTAAAPMTRSMMDARRRRAIDRTWVLRLIGAEVSGARSLRPVGSRGAGGRIEVTGRLRCSVDEGSDPLRRRRHPAAADHPHERQAARPGRQQADPLLRHRGHGRGRHQGDRHHRRRHRATRSRPRSATAPVRASRSRTSRRTRRSASRTACSSRATSSATTTSSCTSATTCCSRA